MILIALNLRAKENYAFYDPKSNLDLKLSNPRGYAPWITDSILRGLRAGTLIDVEGKIDIEKGVLKVGKEQEYKKAIEREEIPAASETKESIVEEKAETKEEKVETKEKSKTKNKK